jgi:FlaA1/EpsC-like NDP-sugar epimerase
MKNKRILITGAAGSIGSELVRQLCKTNTVYGVDLNESGLADLMGELNFPGRVGDIRDDTTVRDIFSDFKPQIVYHAAAYKHVTAMELVPREAINTNIIGTLNLIENAKRWECVEKFVFISTDKAVQSTSIMGATKRVGEIIVRNQGKGFVVVRFGNVLGSRGSVIPIWQRQINQGKNITVTSPEMTRYMMTIEQAVDLVVQASEKGKGGEIFCLDMGEKINVLSLAKAIVKGTSTGIDIIGLRPGEQLTETLMSLEEEALAIKEGNFYVIRS